MKVFSRGTGSKKFVSISPHRQGLLLNNVNIAGSVCMVSDVAIITKTEKDDVSMTYAVNHTGDVTSTKPSHLGQGKQIHTSSMSRQRTCK